MENKSDFIEFENYSGTKILLNINNIRHISKDFQYEKVWTYDDRDSHFLLKDGEYDRIKKELEKRSNSNNGFVIQLPGPRYGL